MRDLLADLAGILQQGKDCVFCSVVETRGSTPQKAGAAMLVFADGNQLGTLGGGCVEAEVKQRALRTLGDPGGSNRALMTFCLDDNYGWDDGLICGGRMTILADPLRSGDSGSADEYFGPFCRMVEDGQGCTESIVIDAKTAHLADGSRYLFDTQGKLVARRSEAAPSEAIMRGLIPVATRPRPYVRQGVSYLPCLPRITLLIVGGGHVGQAVARLGADVDFDIWVLDDRDRYASRERFPAASRLIVGDIGATLKELARQEITPSVYAIIVTRGHAHDEEALYHLAKTPAGYVGMIGSKRKIKLIYDDLRARGIAGEALTRVHAPLGFDIGSQTVPEIAVSIVAELIACRNRGGTIPEARIQVV
ncbi:MAG: XdhC family protein [Planctomycetes bacterium]|nr:XdhC family protein [Planctomycetota bacterium]